MKGYFVGHLSTHLVTIIVLYKSDNLSLALNGAIFGHESIQYLRYTAWFASHSVTHTLSSVLFERNKTSQVSLHTLLFS